MAYHILAFRPNFERTQRNIMSICLFHQIPFNDPSAGHHNIKGKVFRKLKNVRIGDVLTVYAGDRNYKYMVTKRMILREVFQSQEKRLDNARWIGPFSNERVTLVTCWPNWANTHRLIVVARPLTVDRQRELRRLES